MRLKTLLVILCISSVSWLSIKCSPNSNPSEVIPNNHNLSDSTYDVFLVAGQSNTYYGLGLDTALDKCPPGIYQLGRVDANNMKVIEAKEPLQHYFTKPDRIGFALTFAKLYDKSCYYKRNILIIPCGMDWTGFMDSSWKRGDCLYNDAVYRTNFVLNKYPKSKLAGILWCQGEKDVDNPKFEISLDSMIAGFRKDIVGDNAKVPFIMGGMVPFWVELSKERMNQQERIKNTQKRMPYIGYADPYKPFRISKEKDSLDIYHYNAAGQREMGKRFFEEYMRLQTKKK